MTFGKFVTTLRRRLQDIRTISNTLITDITTSGIRWTSEELIEIANIALTELVRTANVYGKSPLLEQIIGSGYFEAKGTMTFAGTELAVPSSIMAITSLIDDAGIDRSWAYLAPAVFYDVSKESGAPREDGWYYTVMYDVATTTRKVVLSQSHTGDLIYSAIYNKDDYTYKTMVKDGLIIKR